MEPQALAAEGPHIQNLKLKNEKHHFMIRKERLSQNSIYAAANTEWPEICWFLERP